MYSITESFYQSFRGRPAKSTKVSEVGPRSATLFCKVGIFIYPGPTLIRNTVKWINKRPRIGTKRIKKIGKRGLPGRIFEQFCVAKRSGTLLVRFCVLFHLGGVLLGVHVYSESCRKMYSVCLLLCRIFVHTWQHFCCVVPNPSFNCFPVPLSMLLELRLCANFYFDA